MGAVVSDRIALSDDIIDRILFDGRRSCKIVLLRLRCLFVWSPGKSVQVLHASFADYLTDPHRCGIKHLLTWLSATNAGWLVFQPMPVRNIIP